MPTLTEKKRFAQNAPIHINDIKRGPDGRSDFTDLISYLKDVSENLRNLNQFVFNEYNSHTINPTAHFSSWKNIRGRRKAFYNSTDNSTTVTFEGSATKPFYVITGDSRQVAIPEGYKFLFATSNVTCDLSTSGVGGLDTGAIASDTPYYLYGVDDDGDVGVIASASNPDTGPSGYTYGHWMYLGSICTQPGSANFPAFYSSNGRIVFDRPIETQTHTGDTNYTALTFDGLPDTAEYGVFSIKVSGPSGGTDAVLSSTNNSGNYVLKQTLQNVSHPVHGQISEVPIITDHTIYVQTSNSSSTVYAIFHGWMEDVTNWP